MVSLDRKIASAVEFLETQPRPRPILFYATPAEWEFHRARAIETGVPFDCFGAQGIVRVSPMPEGPIESTGEQP